MTNKQIAQETKKLYHQFLKENNVQLGTAYAYADKWIKYLQEHKTW